MIALLLSLNEEEIKRLVKGSSISLSNIVEEEAEAEEEEEDEERGFFGG